MLVKQVISGLLAAAAVAEASVMQRAPLEAALLSRQNKNSGNQCLNANAVQTGSASTGQQNGVAADGQVNSATDTANFINFCSGQTLTNGLQIKTGSCNGVVMGKIPAQAKMVSTVLINPKHNDVLTGFQTFNITLRVNNLNAGHFTNATSTYYSAPQDLDGNGIVIGHTHVVVQDLGGSLNPQQPLDASKFTFFKGINTAADGNGILQATVAGGLPDGFYRVCTMSGSSNHQPVLMPVAQRGTQEDCNKFQVKGGTAPPASASSSAAAASTSAASSNNNNNKGNNGGNKGNSGGNKGGNANNAAVVSSSTTKATAATTTTKAATAATSKASTGGNTNNAASGKGGKGGATSSSALGGIAAPSVTKSSDSKRPFSVQGNTFVNQSAAVQRACDIQNNLCANAVNGGTLKGVTVGDCSSQVTVCVSEIQVS